MTVEICARCAETTDTDADHKCPHGIDCGMLDGNSGDCRSECWQCDDSEASWMRARIAHLEARVAELDAEAAEWENIPNRGHFTDATPEALTRAICECAHHVLMATLPLAVAGISRDEAKTDARVMAAKNVYDSAFAEVLKRLQERDELLRPRSPNALELAEAYADTCRNCDNEPCVDSVNAARAALVAYDKRK